ncbi:hypothetical protein O3M35_008830 [Rhynocoris fuscipes]|uniref:Small ribosomal subunit protein mS31 n=1 Tax=Rhynocoris fuscipes TaxID=488301 RepID=A0AAW1DA82_9HEMI
MFVVHGRHILRGVLCEERARFVSLFPCYRSNNENSKGNAAEKLNLLLKSIIKENKITEEKNVPVTSTETKFKKKKSRKEEKPKNLGEKIVEAAKEVAGKVKGDPELTEAELLQKLLYKNENLQKSVFNATKNSNLSELLSGMKVERTPVVKDKRIADDEYNRAAHVRSLMKDKYTKRFTPSISDDAKTQQYLFDAKPLGIFNKELLKDENTLDTWDHCNAREIRLSITHPPTNIYEQMIIWTNRGMLWKFPIDNEQGMDEEQNVSFADHIFLENYLEDWCPTRGPIRHFMELVCVGLSRNYWLTAEEKRDHLLWYKDYFLEKKEIIKEIGAGDFQVAEYTTESSTKN